MIQVICPCQSYSVPPGHDEQIRAFYEMRGTCPALYAVTVPNDIVTAHQAFLEADSDDAYHSSVPFLAYRDGRLAQFTEPIHRYLLRGNVFRPEVSEQYRSDFRETWLLKIDPVSRYHSARRYLSRLAELDFAAWLESERWQIANLEAYGGKFDIEAGDRGRHQAVFEVKFLAQREVVFELNHASFKEPTTGRLGPYSPMDYLLFRIFEAARKLRSDQRRRIVVAILSDYDISFKIPLTEGWIDWKQPSFLRLDSEIESFLADKYANNPKLDNDVHVALSNIDEIWFFRYQSIYSLERVHYVCLS